MIMWRNLQYLLLAHLDLVKTIVKQWILATPSSSKRQSNLEHVFEDARHLPPPSFPHSCDGERGVSPGHVGRGCHGSTFVQSHCVQYWASPLPFTAPFLGFWRAVDILFLPSSSFPLNLGASLSPCASSPILLVLVSLFLSSFFSLKKYMGGENHVGSTTTFLATGTCILICILRRPFLLLCRKALREEQNSAGSPIGKARWPEQGLRHRPPSWAGPASLALCWGWGGRRECLLLQAVLT